MSNEDGSSFLLRDFEPSVVRLKRKLRLILNKNLRKYKTSEENVTFTEFILFSIFLVIVTVICTINHISQDLFYADKCIRRLLVNKLELNTVKTIDEFWNYLNRFNHELYHNVAQWKESTNNFTEQFNHQILLSDENFILGTPRLRQIRVDDTHCQIIKDLSIRSINCYAHYHKSKEYRDKFTSVTGYQYRYTLPKTTAALQLSNIHGPYDTGGFIYNFHPTKDVNDEAIIDLKRGAWLDLSTRAVFIEFIYFNPNTELLTSINILFEFLTTGKDDISKRVVSHIPNFGDASESSAGYVTLLKTKDEIEFSVGTIEAKEFFYTIPINSYFSGRDKVLGIFQILFVLCYIIFCFYYVGQIAKHRLWFIMSSYWNVYDLGLLILFTISGYFDIKFLVYISQTLKCLSMPKNDIFKELVYFIETQIKRIDLQAYVTAATLIRLLRFLPHFSNLTANLLDVFYKSLRNSIGFLFLFFLIFMSFVVFATFHYGNELFEFHTFALSSYTLIRCTLGQFEYDRAYRVSPTWTPIFYMLYVCVIYFVLLNLLVAVVNETYVLGKQEQKQIEDDLQEEYARRTNIEGLNAFHRSKRPVLQTALIRRINPFLKFLFNKSIDLNDNTEMQIDDDDDDGISLEEKQTIIVEKLKNILLNDGYKKDVIETFFRRLLVKNNKDDDDDDIFLLQMEQNQTIKILYDEFKIFNNQYEKLAQDYRKTTRAAREMILVNTVNIEQASLMKHHLDILDQRLKKIENLIPKALENIVELYINHSSTNQINK